MAKSASLAQARALLQKNKKVDLENRVLLDPNNMVAHPAISTGSLVLDFMIGGQKLPNGQRQCPGLPRGRITEIYGNEGAGKTTIALEAAAQVQKRGGSVCFLDYENAISPAYAQSLGVDFSQDKWDLYCPVTWEEGAEITKTMINSGVDLIIVDSVSAMIPQATFEKDPSDTGQIGLLARLMSTFLPGIVGDLRRSQTALVYINQLRSRIKMSKYDPGPDEDTSGGKALKYYVSLRIKLKKVKSEYANLQNDLTGDSEKQAICNIVRAQCTKNKVSSHQGFTSDFVLRYGEGIDNARSIMDIAETRKLIKKGGAWYTFIDASGGEQRFQGKEALRDFLIANPAHFNALAEQILSTVDPTMKATSVALTSEEATEEEDVQVVIVETVLDPELEELLEDAVHDGKIVVAGPWFKFTDELGEAQSVRGKVTMVEYLMDHPELVEHLRSFSE